jgi:hypothetical protein
MLHASARSVNRQIYNTPRLKLLAITETKRMRYELFGMQNRTFLVFFFGPYFFQPYAGPLFL